MGEDEDGSIEGEGGGGIWLAAEEEIYSSTRTGTVFGDVAGVAVEVEDHVGGVEANSGVRVSGHVVEEVVDGFLCFC